MTQRVDKHFRIAAAYTEYKENANLVFDNGEVDIDTGAVGAQRNITGQTTFKGRFAVYKDRKTKKIAWGALPDRVSKKGKKNLTPESYAEMETSYMKHMGDGAIHMSDGSPALTKCAKVKGLPSATVVHGKHEYVKPVKFLKSSLTPKAKAAVCQLQELLPHACGRQCSRGLFRQPPAQQGTRKFAWSRCQQQRSHQPACIELLHEESWS
jgi:hypothetical protein